MSDPSMPDPMRPGPSSKSTRNSSGDLNSVHQTRGNNQHALGLAAIPDFLGRILRAAKRELGANGVRGLLSYAHRRLFLAGDRHYETTVGLYYEQAAASSDKSAIKVFVPGSNDPDAAYRLWINECEALTDDDRAAIKRHIGAMTYQPLISVVVPVYNTSETALRAMVASVQQQLYPHWEMCLADDASPSPHIVRVLTELAKADPRIHWVRREKNGHICAASNSALQLATGEFVALVDHDDLLPENALYEVVAELNTYPDTDLIYSDEDKIDENDQRYGPYFKPDFSCDLLFGQNMVSHFGVYRTSVLHAIGGFREGYEGSQDYDLALRVLQFSGAAKVRHIPAILYHWRQERSGASFSQAQLDKCIAVARRSIQDFLDATSSPADTVRGTVVPNPQVSTWSRVKWDILTPAPLVSVMLLVGGQTDIMSRLITRLLHKIDYKNIEILLINEGTSSITLPKDPRARSVLVPSQMSTSALMNAAAREARGDVLLWLSPEVEGIDPDWLSELVSQVMRPDIGVVGAKLLYKDGRILHGGVRLGAVVDATDAIDGIGIAGFFGNQRHREDIGYFGQLALARDVSAVTGACLAVRRDVWNAIDGADERNLKDAFIDVDLCLRVREAGYRVLWTPFAKLCHQYFPEHGSALLPEKCADITADRQYMRQRWNEQLVNDPFYNANFDARGKDCELAMFRRRSYPWA